MDPRWEAARQAARWQGTGQDFTRFFTLREAVASVSLSHPEECTCEICRAASGDVMAFMHIAEVVDRELDR